MDHAMKSAKVALARLGKEAASALDATIAGSTARERARTLLAEEVRREEKGGEGGWAWRGWTGLRVAAGAAAFALVAVWAARLDVRVPPLTFTVASAPGTVGAWIGARTDAPVPVHFSDGSRVSLDRGSDARVLAIDGVGARVLLERGRARASVVHTATSRWSVGAGPYDVRVTGTRFDVAWDPTTQAFSIELEEGSVVVEGCGLVPRRVAAGQSLTTTCREGASAINQATATPIATPIATATATATVTPIATPTPIPTPEPSWSDLASAGHYAEALSVVRADYDSRCRTFDASDLLLLADVARYAGDAARAKQAWLALRTRFPGDPRAGSAAFFLGRMAFEEGDFGEAERWFRVSLQDAPAGHLAREAAGRLIEACQRAGDEEGARQAARRYLSAYPTGPHAKLAESVATER